MEDTMNADCTYLKDNEHDQLSTTSDKQLTQLITKLQ